MCAGSLKGCLCVRPCRMVWSDVPLLQALYGMPPKHPGLQRWLGQHWLGQLQLTAGCKFCSAAGTVWHSPVARAAAPDLWGSSLLHAPCGPLFLERSAGGNDCSSSPVQLTSVAGIVGTLPGLPHLQSWLGGDYCSCSAAGSAV